MDRESFVRAESINLEVSLLNNTTHLIKLEDLTVPNDPLYFYAMNNLGKKFSGSLQSPRIRDGLRIPPVRKKTMIALQPKNQTAINIDLLDVLGELIEGDYKVKATYSSGLLHVKSKTIFIKVLKATPVYSKTIQDYSRSTSNTIRTAWINREEDGFYLFIMENSQYQPSNIRSNRRILKTNDIQKVCPSILASPEQETEHLIWVQADTIRVASLHQQALKDVKSVKLPISFFQILEPPFTDEDGKLYFVVVSKEKDLTVFQLVSFSLEGEIKTEEICRFRGNFTNYCIIYDEEPRLHMTWASESGDIFYTWFDLEKTIKAEPKMLVTGKTPILNLQVSTACEDEEGNLPLLLNFVNYESPNELHSHLINVDSQETVFHSFSQLPELKDLTLLQTVLDFGCRPHYLFQDRFGALWFKAFEGTELVRVTGEGETYPGNVDYPVLLLSSDVTRHYGIYLRYVKDRSHFVYKKLESLA